MKKVLMISMISMFATLAQAEVYNCNFTYNGVKTKPVASFSIDTNQDHNKFVELDEEGSSIGCVVLHSGFEFLTCSIGGVTLNGTQSELSYMVHSTAEIGTKVLSVGAKANSQDADLICTRQD